MSQEPQSPSIQAAVALERRLGSIEAAMRENTMALQNMERRQAEANGKLGKAETEIEAVSTWTRLHEQQAIDRRLYARIEAVESWQSSRTTALQFKDGFSAGQARLVAMMIAGMGVLIGILSGLIQVAIKLWL